MRIVLRSLALALLFGFVILSAMHASPVEVYTFTGTCSDCTGTGTGTLTLENYTDGDALTAANFVSFTYSSNLLPDVDITSVSRLTGELESTPGDYAVLIVTVGDTFQSSVNGMWCLGRGCGSDHGTAGSWTQLAATPEPGTISLLGTGVLLVETARRRRRHA